MAQDETLELLLSCRTLEEYCHKFGTHKFIMRPNEIPTLAYPRDRNGYRNFEFFTPRQIDQFSSRVAARVAEMGLTRLTPGESAVVALLGNSTVEYTSTFFALSRLGYTTFLLSPRLEPSALAALMVKANCKTVIYEESLQSKIKQTQELCELKSIPIVTRAKLDSKDVIIEPTSEGDTGVVDDSRIGFLWHSSGSTGLPKIFPMTQKSIMERLRSIYMSPYGQQSTFITSSTYNSAGLTFMISALFKSTANYFYNDSLPYTAEGLTRVLREARPNIAVLVPYALAELASTSRGIKSLKICRSVNVFGAVCPTQLGNRLVEQGVKLSISYALSEASSLMGSYSREGDNAWDYVAPLPLAKDHIWMKPIGDNLYECVVLQGLGNCPMSNSDDPPGSFHTGDVFVPHATLPDRWRCIGRIDDTINMSFAATFLALPFEDHVRSQPLVKEAVVFGNGRPKLGLIVFASEDARDMSANNVVGKIWPTVEDMNSQGPPYTRVSKDMIIVRSCGEVYPRTDKQNVIRPQIYNKYEAIISEIYGEGNDIVQPHESSELAKAERL